MSGEYLEAEVVEHEAEMKVMRERQEAVRKSKIEEHEAAMQAIKIAEQKAADIAEDLKMMKERDEEELSAAMQAFEIKVASRRLYHEAPNDVFELIFHPLSDLDEWVMGGLNVMRLVSKPCMRVVESVATRLIGDETVTALPTSFLKRCRRIEHIRCVRLMSLEGCPDGLKSLSISSGSLLESLEPLSSCKGLDSLEIYSTFKLYDISPLSSCTSLRKLNLTYSKITDLTPLSSMLLLEELDLSNGSINDISALSQCKKLKKLDTGDNQGIVDLSPLCPCPNLEVLCIGGLTLVEDFSFLERGFTKLRALDIRRLPLDDLSPLTHLQSPEEISCQGIFLSTCTSLLARCYKLKRIICSRGAFLLAELNNMRERRQDIQVSFI